MPERVQLSRQRGWRMPAGAVKVARPTNWGNPYTVAGAIEIGYAHDEDQGRKVAVEFFRSWLLGLDGDGNDQYVTGGRAYDRLWMREHLPDLYGKTLACWCPPGAACHADVLAAVVRGEDEAGRVLMGMLHPFNLPVGW